MKDAAAAKRSLRQGLFYLVPFTICLCVLAYQFPFSQTLQIGGDAALRRRDDERPFLSGAHGAEPADRLPDPANPDRRISWWQLLARTGERPYRWTQGETTLRLPGVGGGAWQLELLAARGGRPGAVPTLSRWQPGGGPSVEVALPVGPARRYRLLIPSDQRGDLSLTISTPTFSAGGDPRELGFVLHQARVLPLGGGPRSPAWPQIGWLALTVGLVYGASYGLGAGVRGGLALAGGAALVAAYALAAQRMGLTVFTPALTGLSLLGALVAGAGRIATRGLEQGNPGAARFARQVLGLATLAFALRLGGMVHPHALYSDAGFHANKLYTLTLGQVFQSAGLPDESGGGDAPYPTAPYLLLAPGQLLLPPGHRPRVLLMQSGTALLDSLTLPLIALLLVRAGLGRGAALLGAACYLLPITALESFAVGELANIAGQAIALPCVALLALGYARAGAQSRRPAAGSRAEAGPQDRQGSRKWQDVALIAALCAGLLAHAGVTLSLGALVAAAWALALAGRLRGRTGAIDPLHLALVGATALAITGVIYYSAPLYLDTLLDRLGLANSVAEVADLGAGTDGPAGVGEAAVGAGGPAGTPPLELLRETALGLLGLAPPRSRPWPIPAPLGIAALGGMALLWSRRRDQPEAAGLRITLGAWWLGMLITQALLLVADQGVRWSMFLYPALCLGAGPLLDGLWRRGRAGRLAAGLAVAAIIAYGLAIWVIQVRDYYHI